MDEEILYVALETEDGTEIETEVLGVYEAGGQEYVALDPNDGTEEVYLYRYRELPDGDFEISDIEDDAEFELAAAEFDRLSEEE